MTPDISRWRSSETYEHLDALDSPDLAWEWLRRNTDYQKDYARADTPSLKRELRRKWDLQFFRPAVAECWRGSRDLVGGGGHQRRAARTDAHYSADGRQSLFRAARISRARGRGRHTFPVQVWRPSDSDRTARRRAA
ncbi:transcriptional regulator domain-containing protein [Phyllobacterium ifriqiyense]|uniref:transcriptional regulator domain-containing protein n=1 Tax=Phyllobacterium ifriqiyense TaxID=314238 RepID=UPI003399EBDB